MRISDTIQDSIVDGPGLRFVIFTQGCPHHCPGCHNPATHDPDGGQEISQDEILSRMLNNPMTDGITLSGGEPFYQAAQLIPIVKIAREHGLNVWAWSGWTYEQLITSNDPDKLELLKLCDVLVDGRFVLAQRSLSLKWRGSANQRVIDLNKTRKSGNVAIYTPPDYGIEAFTIPTAW